MVLTNSWSDADNVSEQSGATVEVETGIGSSNDRLRVEERIGAVARARFAIRKVLRIVDEQARIAGIDPLHHQALIQIYGAPQRLLHVTALAERLDVPAALASRLVTTLEQRGLVRRERSSADLRMIEVHVTEPGVDILVEIFTAISRELGYFSSQLSDDDKMDSLSVLAAYVGLRLDGNVIVNPSASSSTPS